MINRTLVGTKWKCTDEDMDEYGMMGTVKSGILTDDDNGNNEITIIYEDGSEFPMKLYRFITRHTEIK